LLAATPLSAGSGPESFFSALESAVIQGLVQRGGEDVQLLTDLRHTLPLIQQALRLGQSLGRQPMALTTRRWLEESGRPAFAILATGALDRGQRHAEGFDDLALGGGAVDDELGGEKAEAGQIVGAMSEDGQVAVEINHLILTALEGQLGIDGGRADWK